MFVNELNSNQDSLGLSAGPRLQRALAGKAAGDPRRALRVALATNTPPIGTEEEILLLHLDNNGDIFETDDPPGCSERELELMAQLEVLLKQNRSLEQRGKQLAQELDVFRQRRLVALSDRLRNRFDAWHLMHPGFEDLKDDTVLFQGDLKGFRLLPSVSLLRVNSLTYELNLGRAGLEALLLAPILDMPSQEGEICIRIVSSKQDVLRELSFPIANVSDSHPSVFRFSSLGKASAERLTLHVFAQNVDVPLRLFELKRYAFFGLGRLSRKLFAGYQFEISPCRPG